MKKILRNKIFGYLALRYLAYGLQFLSSIIVAYRLGPNEFAIWAFLLLIIQSFAQINFGIPIAVQNSLSIYIHRKNYINFTISSGFVLTLINLFLSSLILLLMYSLNFFNWNNKDLSSYFPILLVVIGIGYVNILLQNIFRVFNSYGAINFFQILLPVLLFSCSLFIAKENLVYWLTLCHLISATISLFSFMYFFPIKIQFRTNFRTLKKLTIKSIKLFFYNSSFYLIIISTRIICSESFDQSEFGLFSFAFTLVAAFVLLLDSFSFLIHPKLMNKFSRMSHNSIDGYFNIKNEYSFVSHSLLYSGVAIFYLGIHLFPEYSNSFEIFIVLAMAYAINSMGFGLNAILMSKEHDSLLARISSSGLIINIVLSLFLVYIESPVLYIGITILLTFTFILLFQYIVVLKSLNIPFKRDSILKNLFPINFLIPVLFNILLVAVRAPKEYFLAGIILFLVLNISSAQRVVLRIVSIIRNPSLIELNR